MSNFNSRNWRGPGLRDDPLKRAESISSSDQQFQNNLAFWQDQDEITAELREFAHTLNVENQINETSNTTLKYASPAKKRHLERLRRVDAMGNVPREKKDILKRKLNQSYADSKCAPGPTKMPAKLLTPSKDKHLTALGLARADSRRRMSKEQGLDNTAGNVTKYHVRREEADGSFVEYDIAHSADGDEFNFMMEPWQEKQRSSSVPYREGIWTTAEVQKFPTILDALATIMPCYKAVKTRLLPHRYIREYFCECDGCPYRMRILSSDRTTYARNVVTQTLHPHQGHIPEDWDRHYVAITEGSTSGKGLPKDIGLVVEMYAHLSGKGPTGVFNHVSKACKQLDDLLERSPGLVREYIKQQVFNRVKNLRRKDGSKKRANLPTSGLKYSGDIRAFVRHYRLNLPDNFHQQIIECPEHMREIAHFLSMDGNLTFLRADPDTPPHRGMITLDYDITRDDIAQRVEQLTKKREREKVIENENGKYVEDPKDNMIVFTSLALLRTICDCEKLEWKVCFSADGTHDISKNDYRLIPLGVISVDDKGCRSFRPLVFAWCSGEIELCVVVAIHHLNKAVWDLFAIAPRFYACISDHAPTFVNAFKLFWPKTRKWICFPHIIRKFIINGDRQHNGQYKYKLVRNWPGWLEEVAAEDVKLLRECRTKEMFETLKNLVSDGWIQYGEMVVRNIFFEQYIEKHDYNQWQQFCSEHPSCTAQQQSNENFFLMTKGRYDMEGIIKIGRPFEPTVQEEFPKLVENCSQHRHTCERHNPMANKDWILGKTRVKEYFEKIQFDKDVVKYKGGHLVNCSAAVRWPINSKRLREYEEVLAGKCNVCPGNRRDWCQRVLLLCHVTKSPDGSNWQGSCWHFWNNGWCLHAATVQYRTELGHEGKPIANVKSSVTKRKMLGRRNKETFRRQVRKNEIQAMNAEHQNEIETIKRQHEQRKKELLQFNKSQLDELMMRHGQDGDESHEAPLTQEKAQKATQDGREPIDPQSRLNVVESTQETIYPEGSLGHDMSGASNNARRVNFNSTLVATRVLANKDNAPNFQQKALPTPNLATMNVPVQRNVALGRTGSLVQEEDFQQCQRLPVHRNVAVGRMGSLVQEEGFLQGQRTDSVPNAKTIGGSNGVIGTANPLLHNAGGSSLMGIRQRPNDSGSFRIQSINRPIGVNQLLGNVSFGNFVNDIGGTSTLSLNSQQLLRRQDLLQLLLQDDTINAARGNVTWNGQI